MNSLLTRDTKSSTKDSTALQKANVKVKMFRGINSVIYKKKKKGSQGCSSSWLWSLSLWMGWISVLDIFLVGGACACVLLMDLDLISLKSRAVSSSRSWGVYGFSMPLGSPSGFGRVQFSSVQLLSHVRLFATP